MQQLEQVLFTVVNLYAVDLKADSVPVLVDQQINVLIQMMPELSANKVKFFLGDEESVVSYWVCLN